MQKIKKYKALILDDEKESRRIFEILLEKYEDISVVASEENADTALEKMIYLQPDIVFMDINLKDRNAFSVLRSIRSYNLKCTVVFFTAYYDFAIEAIKNSVFDYLLKPIDPEELANTIDRFRQSKKDEFSQEKNDALLNLMQLNAKLKFNIKSGSIFLHPNEIIYCEADGNYTILYIDSQKKEVVTAKLGQVEELLPSISFIRVGRSHIINADYLTKIDRKKHLIELIKDGETFELFLSSKIINKFLN
ncbi:MAG: LytR/AlgR family response regulator transcription factor [Cyclobacteriaceae bacterium]